MSTKTICDFCDDDKANTKNQIFTLGKYPRKVAEDTDSDLEILFDLDLCHACAMNLLDRAISTYAHLPGYNFRRLREWMLEPITHKLRNGKEEQFSKLLKEARQNERDIWKTCFTEG